MMEKVSLHPFIALLILCVLAVSAHASVMALASSVLHDIISNAKLRCVSPLREEDQKEGVSATMMRTVRMEGTSLLTFESLMTFGYIRTLHMQDMQHAMCVLQCSRRLQMHVAVGLCCGWVMKHIAPDNVLNVMLLAKEFELQPLHSHCRAFALENIQKVVQCAEILHLSEDDFANLMSDDAAVITSELQVFTTVVRWINHDTEARRCMPAYLALATSTHSSLRCLP